jgi:hypothetical protein
LHKAEGDEACASDVICLKHKLDHIICL